MCLANISLTLTNQKISYKMKIEELKKKKKATEITNNHIATILVSFSSVFYISYSVMSIRKMNNNNNKQDIEKTKTQRFS